MAVRRSGRTSNNITREIAYLRREFPSFYREAGDQIVRMLAEHLATCRREFGEKSVAPMAASAIRDIADRAAMTVPIYKACSIDLHVFDMQRHWPSMFRTPSGKRKGKEIERCREVARALRSPKAKSV